MHWKDLVSDLKSELSGQFEKSVLFSIYDPEYLDAYCLRKAMEGAGTDEGCLTEILTSRSNDQIVRIKARYEKGRCNKKKLKNLHLCIAAS